MARISSSAALATKCVQTDLPRPTPGEAREISFLDMLGDALGLDRTTTAAFERCIRARNMTL